MNLKELRLKKKLTQDAIAKQLGISKATVCLWERGLVVPRKKSFKKLSEVLGIESSQLLTFFYE